MSEFTSYHTLKAGQLLVLPQSFEISLFKLRVTLLFIIAQCTLARTSYDSLKMKIDYNTKRELFSKCKFKIEENKNVFYFSTAAPAFIFFFCQSLNSRIPCLRCAFQTKPGSSSFFPPRCTFSQQRTQTFVVHAANKHIWISMCDVQGLESVPAQLIPPLL